MSGNLPRLGGIDIGSGWHPTRTKLNQGRSRRVGEQVALAGDLADAGRQEMTVFWSRLRREERRQRVLDELLTLDAVNRRYRLDAAVAAHELRAEEVEPALRLVDRLDRLREMRVPLGGHLPGRQNLPPEPQAADRTLSASNAVAADTRPESGDDLASAVGESTPIGIAVIADPDPDPVDTWLGSVDMPLDAIEAVSQLKAGRRVRRGRPGARGPGTVRRRARAAGHTVPAGATVVAEMAAARVAMTDPAADENWPSIAWLRP